MRLTAVLMKPRGKRSIRRAVWLFAVAALSLAIATSGRALDRGALPSAGSVVRTLPIPVSDSVLFSSRAGSLFAVDVAPSPPKAIDVIRATGKGTVTRRRVAFALPYYVADVSAGPDGIYVGTAVIKRFTQQRDQLVRIDPKTLAVRARASFPASVATVESGDRMWASLGDGHVVRLDPRALAIEASRQLLSTAARARAAIVTKPAYGLGSVWVLAGDGYDLELVRLDPMTLKIRSKTRIPTGGHLAQALYNVVADADHVYLVGHAIAAVDASGKLIGRPTLVPNLETATIYGNYLVGASSVPPSLLLLDRHGRLLAKTSLRDGSARLTVSGRSAWFLGDAGQGEGIVTVRLRLPTASQRSALAAQTPAQHCPAAVAHAGDLGRLAFIRGGALALVDLRSCRARTLVARGVAPPLRSSADGRYLAFGNGAVVAANGGTVAHPLGSLAPGWGSGPAGWAWSPDGHRLAGITSKGGVAIGGPGIRGHALLPADWGATSVAFSPNGRMLAISRSQYLKSPPPYHQEIWLIDLANGLKRELFHIAKPALAPPYLYSFSPGGRWLIAWEDTQNSASLAADGLPLIAVSTSGGRAVRVGRGTLVYGDFLSWCNDALAYAVNRGGRQVTLGDRVALAAPPSWTPSVTPGFIKETHSYNSPACYSPLFELAGAVGPSTPDTPFGHEHRRIWLLGYTGGNWHPLERRPPMGSSDELPMWSRDGRWIAFIRTHYSVRSDRYRGELYLLDLGRRFNGRAKLVGPIAPVGTTGNYYGHYGWFGQLAWYRG